MSTNHNASKKRGRDGSTATESNRRPRITEVDVVDFQKTSAAHFFKTHVAARRPCLIRGMMPMDKNNHVLSLNKLEEVIGDCTVEVEKRSSEQRDFGQNRANDLTIRMTVKEFLKQIQDPATKEMLYLSTQQGELYQEMNKRLSASGNIPSSHALSGNLVLESMNLWMGASSESKSGLHHDFHDNWYVLHSGIKRFVLYPPTTPIPVFGDIDMIHPNGLISYKSNPTRADGVPLAIEGEGSEDHLGSDVDGESEEDEAFVIGKGCDYVSSDEENGEGEDKQNVVKTMGSNKPVLPTSLVEKDDFDQIENEASEEDQEETGERPDHFSPMDIPSFDPSKSQCGPVVGNVNPIFVELKAGESLYLPASWFHCVFSSLSSSEVVHLAVNYWYHPPDNLTCFEQPYHDIEYWKKLKNDS